MTEQERERMILDNMGLVKSMAQRYARLPGKFDDLVQAGTEGLIRAVDKFDPDRGFKFSTYAHFWIRNSLQREVRQDESFGVSDEFAKNLYKVKVTENVLLGRDVPQTPENVAEESGIELRKVEQLMGYETPLSLDWELEKAAYVEQDWQPLQEALGGEDDYSGLELRTMLDTLPKHLARAVVYPMLGVTGDSAGALEGVTRTIMGRRRQEAFECLTSMI